MCGFGQIFEFIKKAGRPKMSLNFEIQFSMKESQTIGS
jgi:hypothetical protein